MLLAPVTNWEPRGVTLAGYCYVMRHGVSHLKLTALWYAVTLQVFTRLWMNREPGFENQLENKFRPLAIYYRVLQKELYNHNFPR
jgi:hypothetical protein